MRRLFTLCLLTMLVRAAPAQGVAGILLRADSTPAAGVIVVASRSAGDSVIARTMTSGSGRFALDLPPGTVRLRALRIGHRPFVIGTIDLNAGETRTLRAVLANDPIVLTAVTTRVRAACRRTGAAGEAVAAVFEEARKALLSTKLTSRDVRPVVLISHYKAMRSLGGRALSPREHEFSEGESLRPFQSLTPDSLARVGYVETDATGSTYWAPDADVLLSEPFAAAHCMDLTSGRGERAGSIGLTFRPAARPAGQVDVRGTLWLDQGTSELRRMEYWYEGLSPEMNRANPGGTMEFTRLADGFWFISGWEMRIPRTEMRVGVARVITVAVRGGEVWRVKRGSDLVFTNGVAYPVQDAAARPAGTSPAATAAGSGARLQADTTPMPLQCEEGATGASTRMLHGIVYDERGAPLGDAEITAEWQEIQGTTGGLPAWQARRLTTTTTRGGYFALCGVPRVQLMTAWAQQGARTSARVTLRVAESEARVGVDLRIGGVRARGNPDRATP